MTNIEADRDRILEYGELLHILKQNGRIFCLEIHY